MTDTARTPVLLRYDDAVARIEKAAEGREDYVNAVKDDDGEPLPCTNLTPDGLPSCIVGTAFYTEAIEAGLAPTAKQNGEGVGALLEEVLSDYFQVTAKALRFLEAVQCEQDFGSPWGKAIENAKKRMENDPCYGDEQDTDAVEHPAAY